MLVLYCSWFYFRMYCPPVLGVKMVVEYKYRFLCFCFCCYYCCCCCVVSWQASTKYLHERLLVVLVSPPLPATITPHRAGGICNISSGGSSGGTLGGAPRSEKEDGDSAYGSGSEACSSASTDENDSESIIFSGRW